MMRPGAAGRYGEPALPALWRPDVLACCRRECHLLDQVVPFQCRAWPSWDPPLIRAWPTAQQSAEELQRAGGFRRGEGAVRADGPAVGGRSAGQAIEFAEGAVADGPAGAGGVTWDYVVPSQCSASFSRLTGLLKVP